MSRLEMGIMQLLNTGVKHNPRAIREVMHWKKSFGDVVPLQPAPIIQVYFVERKPREEMPANQTSIPDPWLDDELPRIRSMAMSHKASNSGT